MTFFTFEERNRPDNDADAADEHGSDVGNLFELFQTGFFMMIPF
jgi:hypothetical protein